MYSMYGHEKDANTSLQNESTTRDVTPRWRQKGKARERIMVLNVLGSRILVWTL